LKSCLVSWSSFAMSTLSCIPNTSGVCVTGRFWKTRIPWERNSRSVRACFDSKNFANLTLSGHQDNHTFFLVFRSTDGIKTCCPDLGLQIWV
jgi:hypothetical protein